LVWRWDIFGPERVFPITAHFLPDEHAKAISARVRLRR
jgi:hypothetical protein